MTTPEDTDSLVIEKITVNYQPLMLPTTNVYVFLLAHEKYYVGRSNVVKERILDHIKGKGSEWTRAHPPIAVLDIRRDCSFFEEDMVTKQYMSHYGLDAVRGGSYVTMFLTLNEQDFLRREIANAQQTCFGCGSMSHLVMNCPTSGNKVLTQKPRRLRSDYTASPAFPYYKRTCYNCGLNGHYIRDCTSSSCRHEDSKVPLWRRQPPIRDSDSNSSNSNSDEEKSFTRVNGSPNTHKKKQDNNDTPLENSFSALALVDEEDSESNSSNSSDEESKPIPLPDITSRVVIDDGGGGAGTANTSDKWETSEGQQDRLESRFPFARLTFGVDMDKIVVIDSSGMHPGVIDNNHNTTITIPPPPRELTMDEKIVEQRQPSMVFPCSCSLKGGGGIRVTCFYLEIIQIKHSL